MKCSVRLTVFIGSKVWDRHTVVGGKYRAARKNLYRLKKEVNIMSRTETVILTNMCMVYDDNKVLVQDKLDPKWRGATFPGGHVEKGESFTDAVIREVYEETGLTISCPQLCGIKSWMKNDGTRYMVLLYKTNQFTGEVRSSEEGEVFWVDLEDFPGLQLAGGMEDMLKVFLEDNLSEFYYYQEDGTWKYMLK